MDGHHFIMLTVQKNYILTLHQNIAKSNQFNAYFAFQLSSLKQNKMAKPATDTMITTSRVNPLTAGYIRVFIFY